MTALDVQRSAIASKPQHQTTGAVLIVRIVFDDLALCERLTYFLQRDMTQDAVIDGVLRDLKLVCLDFGAYLVNHDSATCSWLCQRLPESGFLSTVPLDVQFGSVKLNNIV